MVEQSLIQKIGLSVPRKTTEFFSVTWKISSLNNAIYLKRIKQLILSKFLGEDLNFLTFVKSTCFLLTA